MRYHWTFGSSRSNGYKAIQFQRKTYMVHRLMCRAFHGLAPEDKPEVDHINRIRDDNRPSNLRWTSRKENEDNKDSVDKSIEKYRVRHCDDPKAYDKSWHESHYEERKQHVKAYHTAYYAEKKAQGLAMRKGPDGKWRWYPRIRA